MMHIVSNHNNLQFNHLADTFNPKRLTMRKVIHHHNTIKIKIIIQHHHTTNAEKNILS